MVLQFYKNEPNEPSKLNCLKFFFPPCRHLYLQMTWTPRSADLSVINETLLQNACRVFFTWQAWSSIITTRAQNLNQPFLKFKKKKEEKKRVQSVCDDIQVETMEYYNFKLDHRKLKVIEWGRSQQGHNMVTCIFLSM